jgi:hypothetical protein
MLKACGCDGLTPAEIELLWQTAPPRVSILPSGARNRISK